MPDNDNYTSNVFKQIYFAPYTLNNQYKLFNAVRGNKDTIQRLKLLQKLPAHNGCVNTVSWNETGEYLLSGSDDQRLCITNGYTFKTLTSIHTNHRANIFSAKFLPNACDKKVISCAGDGIIIFTNLDRSEECFSSSFNCHFGTAYKIVTVPNDPHTFLSCGEDGTVRWYDLRVKQSCARDDCHEDILINCRRAVTALAVNPITPYQLAVGCSDSHVQLFDRRMMGTKATGGAPHKTSVSVTRFTVSGFENRSHRITSLVYNSNAEEMLVSYSSEYLYLFKLKDLEENGGKLGLDFAQSRKKNSATPSLMKRLRLRGDWSDTGPNARPEREMQGDSSLRPSVHTSLMQRMSDVLTRMLNEPGRSARSSSQRTTTNPSSSQEGVQNSASEGVGSPASVAFTDSEESVGSSESSQVTVQSGSEPRILITSVQETTINQDTSNDYTSSQTMFPSRVEPASTLSEDMFSSNLQQILSVSNICDNEQNQKEENEDSTSHLDNKVDAVEKPLDQNRSPEHDVAAKDTESHECLMQSSSFVETKELGVLPEENAPQDSSEPTQSTESTKDSTDVIVSVELSKEDEMKLESVPLESMESEMIEDRNEESNNAPAASTSGISASCVHHLSTSETLLDSEREQKKIDMATSLKLEAVSAPSNEIGLSDESTDKTKMAVGSNRGPEDSSDLSLDRTEDSLGISHPESNETSLETSSRSETSRIPEPSSNSSSSEEELPRCWFRRHGTITESRSDMSGELVRNMEEALSGPADDTSSTNGRRYYYLPPPKLLHKFTGHRNARTMIKEANFWGDHYVMSGSDCGHIFFWDRHTAEVVMILEADHHVVNCIQPHPFDPVLASSGIDYDIKLWAPLQEEPSFDHQLASEIMHRNEVMLEETRDTITVPASFMIRMLASLNHLRTGTRLRSSRSESSQEN